MYGGVHRCVMCIELHGYSPICVHVNVSYLKILDHETLLWGVSYGFLPPLWVPLPHAPYISVVPKVGNSEHDDLVLRSGKLSTDSLSDTDVGDAAEAITTASTETPVWESLHGV